MFVISILYPRGQGPQNGLFHMLENFIKRKLEWTFQVGQCIMFDPPNLHGQGALGYPEQALSVILEDNSNRAFVSF